MPIKWRIDHDHLVVVSEISGRVAHAPATAYMAATFGAGGAGYDELVISLHAITIDMKAPELRAFLVERGFHQSGRPARIAMVSDANTVFGVARMISMMAESVAEVEAKSFRDLPGALEWLGLPADYAAGAELLTGVIE